VPKGHLGILVKISNTDVVLGEQPPGGTPKERSHVDRPAIGSHLVAGEADLELEFVAGRIASHDAVMGNEAEEHQSGPSEIGERRHRPGDGLSLARGQLRHGQNGAAEPKLLQAGGLSRTHGRQDSLASG